jgi:hypothetical protein
VLQKPWLLTGHDLVETDSLLAFEHAEKLTSESNSLLPQHTGESEKANEARDGSRQFFSPK